MSIPDHAVSVDIDVPFCHCDPLQVVWHGRYFEYLETARTKLMRSIDLDVGQLAALGFRMYLVDARIRYMRPLRYGEVARCTAWFSDVRPHIKIAYTLNKVGEDARIARAYTVIATTTSQGELVPETPGSLIARLPVEG